MFWDRQPFKLIQNVFPFYFKCMSLNVNRQLIIVNQQGCLPSPGSPVYTFHYKQGCRKILSKTPVFRFMLSPLIMYMWSQSGEKKVDICLYIPYQIQIIEFVCCFQSLSLANLIEYRENGAAPSEQLGKQPKWQMVHLIHKHSKSNRVLTNFVNKQHTPIWVLREKGKPLHVYYYKITKHSLCVCACMHVSFI